MRRLTEISIWKLCVKHKVNFVLRGDHLGVAAAAINWSNTVHIHTDRQTYVHTHTHTDRYTQMQTDTYTQTCISRYTGTYTDTDTQTYRHTHTQTDVYLLPA